MQRSWKGRGQQELLIKKAPQKRKWKLRDCLLNLPLVTLLVGLRQSPWLRRGWPTENLINSISCLGYCSTSPAHGWYRERNSHMQQWQRDFEQSLIKLGPGFQLPSVCKRIASNSLHLWLCKSSTNLQQIAHLKPFLRAAPVHLSQQPALPDMLPAGKAWQLDGLNTHQKK